MKNCTELRMNLSEVYEGIKDKTIAVQDAQQLIAAARVMVYSAGKEVEYAKARREVPEIEFLSK
jgi:predicted nuclease with RNAse H fold